ncbi:alpha/beta fold hydrolase [Lysobacter koreensis]|uniref:Alpha/beta fold hydrolase n=1 Tax=Lysobacter koreensis TaxID=266122 RepID=A0ABW2YS64_9GAMM
MTRVVLLPGLDGGGELLAEFAAALAPEFTATVVSYPRDVGLDYAALTALVCERLPRDEPFALVAESFSGPVAIMLAASRPEGLLGVVLCASFATAPRPRLRAFTGLLRALPFRWFPTGLLMPLLMGRWSSRAWSRRVHDAVRAVQPAVLRRRLLDVGTVDVSALVAEINCPLLYLQASRDRLVPYEAWVTIRDRSRHAVCIEIEGPHFLLQARPEECAAAIKR